MPANNLSLYAQFAQQETPPNDSGKTPKQGIGETASLHTQNDGGTSATDSDIGKSSTSMMYLPKQAMKQWLANYFLRFMLRIGSRLHEEKS